MSMTRVYGHPKPVNVTTAQPFPVSDAHDMTGVPVKKIESLRDAGTIKRGGPGEKDKVIVAKWKEKGKTVHGLPLVDQTPTGATKTTIGSIKLDVTIDMAHAEKVVRQLAKVYGWDAVEQLIQEWRAEKK